MANKTFLEVVIAADPKSLEKGTRRADRALDHLGKDADRAGKRVGGAFKGMGKAAGLAGGAIAAAGIGDFLRDSVVAAGESEKSTARLSSALKASGISYKAHAKDIDRVIQKQSQLAALDDEDLQDAFTNIVRSTGNVSQSMKLVATASDLARAKQMDVAKAGQVVAKATLGNVGVLRRYGISIDPVTQAQDRLKNSTKKASDEQIEAAKKADKQATSNRVLAALQQKFAGSAEAYGKTNAAAGERASVAWENLQETVGASLAPSFGKAANAASTFITQLQSGEGTGGRVAAALGNAGRAIATGFDTAKTAVLGFVRDNRQSFESIGRSAQVIGEKLRDVFEGFVLPALRRALPGITGLLRGVLTTVKGVVDTVAGILSGDWGRAWDGAKNIVSGGVRAVLGYLRAITSPFREAVSQIARPVGRVLGGAFTALKGVVADAGAFILRRLDNILGGISSMLSVAGKIPGIGGKFKDAAAGIDRAREKLRDTATELDNVNSKRNVRISVKVDAVAGKVTDVVNDTVKSIGKVIGDGIGRKMPAMGRVPSSGLMGASSALTPLARIGGAAGLQVTSGKRAAGGRTSSGGVSYHGSGEAIDMAGSPNGMLRAFRALKARFGPRLAELIYTPGGVGIKNGQPHRYGGKVAADHYDHVHVAMDLGAPGPGLGDGPGRLGPFMGDGDGRSFVSTAYGPPWDAMNGTGVTATGVDLKNAPKRYGIAVDPRQIPLGSRVKVWPNPFGYRGAFTAFDTGGAIKGNRIDFYDWRGRQAQMGWGRQSVTVTPVSGSIKGGGKETAAMRKAANAAKARAERIATRTKTATEKALDRARGQADRQSGANERGMAARGTLDGLLGGNGRRMLDAIKLSQAKAALTKDPADDLAQAEYELQLYEGLRRSKGFKKATPAGQTAVLEAIKTARDNVANLKTGDTSTPADSALEFIRGRQGLNAVDISRAGLTETLADDIRPLSLAVDQARQAFDRSRVVYGDGSQEAADALLALEQATKTLADTQTQLAEQQRDQARQPFRDRINGLDDDLVRAQVDTPDDTRDDLAVVTGKLAAATDGYANAIERGDSAAVIEFGQQVLSLRGDLKGLQASVEQNTQAMLDAEKAARERAERLLAVSQAQYPAFLAGLLDAYSARQGGSVSLGLKSVGYAGGGFTH